MTRQHSDNSVTTLQPIETRAYGHRFRSRLEARWAVFFTALGLRWEYEPEGFNIDGHRYLPDFRVLTPQGLPTWYEIKPETIATDEKFSAFGNALNPPSDAHTQPQMVRSSLLSGTPKHVFSTHTLCPRCGQIIQNSDVYDCSDEMGVSCWECDWETPFGKGDVEDLQADGLTDYYPHKGFIMVSKPLWNLFEGKINNAISLASSARFEHGETP